MREAALLVFPSETYEGFPMAIVEAFAAGLPVVAGRLGAMSTIVRPGVCGELFQPGDPGNLEATVAALARDEARLQALGLGAAAEFQELYTPERNYRALLEAYRVAAA